jgi:cytochrome oxidase Cu insertion factor (SCO1/SenC/PrrC family)
MLKVFLGLAVMLGLTATAAAQQAAQLAPARPAQQPAAPKTHLKVGDPAPDFTLRDTNGKEVKLSDYKGKKNVVLAFYVFAFTGG